MASPTAHIPALFANMRALVHFALFGLISTVTGQLTLDDFNSILASGAAKAGIPECGVSCLHDAFSWSKNSRSCFVDTLGIDCLCDNPDLEGGLLLCSSKVCGRADSDKVVASVREICTFVISSNSSVISTTSTSTAVTVISATVAANIRTIISTTSKSVIGSQTSTPPSSPAPSFAPSQPEESLSSHSARLSTEVIAGITAGVAVVALAAILLAVIMRRRRGRNEESATLQILSSSIYEQAGKAELTGTEADGASRFSLSPKPELPADRNYMDAKHLVSVADLSHPELSDGVKELDSHEKRPAETFELSGPESHRDDRQANFYGPAPPPHVGLNLVRGQGIQTAPQKNIYSSMSYPQGESSSPLAGPIPSASDLYPSPQSRML